MGMGVSPKHMLTKIISLYAKYFLAHRRQKKNPESPEKRKKKSNPQKTLGKTSIALISLSLSKI